MPRSVRVREQAVKAIKSALLRNGYPSQRLLAEELGLSQSTVSNFLNGVPVDYINFIEICRVLGQDWQGIADLEPTTESAKVFINHCGSEPDNHIAQALTQSLEASEYQVLKATKGVTAELKRCDYFLLLLSATAATSEVVIEQVRQAFELRDSRSEPKPIILPIRINLPQKTSLSDDLQNYLEGVTQWEWHSPADTLILGQELLKLLKAGQVPHPLPIVVPELPAGQVQLAFLSHPLSMAAPELPEGQVQVASLFYVNRPPEEEQCYEEIRKPGSLIRIKAPRQMGKTSLMARILHQAEEQGDFTLSLSFQLANQSFFSNSDKFLHWFCANVSRELAKADQELQHKLLSQLAEHWQLAEIMGSNMSCKAFLEECILPTISQPLVLGLDEVDRVFEYPEIYSDFFGLLRAVHEEAKRRSAWKQLKLIVVHSTEVYVPLDINQSPFNVGLSVELREFSVEQVQDLAERHQLNWSTAEVKQLMAIVGGHPFLVRLGLYHIARQNLTLTQLQQTAATETGIYSDHLRRQELILSQHPELAAAMREVVQANGSVRLKAVAKFKLHSMGLVKLLGDEVTLRCNLYREYFRDR